MCETALHLDQAFVVLRFNTMHSHRTLVHNGKIYISGGFSATHRGKCGLFDCKDGVDPSGSLRMYMDDVWARYVEHNLSV